MANRGGPPPSFKTDVHRAPTKKWADAKSYSYAGDDWGGYDEYGEYGSYDDPPPMPKPTGLRQRGQVPVADAGVAGPSSSPLPGSRPRADSFEAGDESRSFSAGAMPPSSDVQTPQNITDPHPSSVTYPQAKRIPSQDMMAGSTIPSLSSTQLRQSTGTQGSSRSASRDRYADPVAFQSTAPAPSASSELYGTSRSYSNSPVPRPMYSDPPPPVLSSAAPGDADASFPPRKSSLSTRRPSDVPAVVQPPPREDSLPPGLSAQPINVSQDAAEPTVAKPFPFIRPADIYKRIQEEKDKERRSMDSARSSVESLPRAGRDDRSLSSNSQARESSGSPARMRPSLQPVPERKSEYGLEGLSAQNPELAKAIATETEPQTADEEVQPPETQVFPPDSQIQSTVAGVSTDGLHDGSTDIQTLQRDSQGSSVESQGVPRESQDSTSSARSGPALLPSLPQVGRFSGFGTDFWGDPTSAQEPPFQASSGPTVATESSAPLPEATTAAASSSDPPLQHQPSLGFRSAVEHAFEPQTPLSVLGSQRSVAGSDLSGSSNTTGISPIMSRMPSAATAMRDAQARGEPLPTPPIITEEPPDPSSPDSRPTSATTLTGPTDAIDPTQSRIVSAESGANQPSSGNLPEPTAAAARGIAVHTEQVLPQGSAAEIGRESPSSNYTQTPAGDTPVADARLGQSDNANDYAEEQSSRSRQDSTGATETSPIDRAAGTTTPSKGRVRDLASRYDVMHTSRQDSFDSTTSSRSRPISPANALALADTTDKDTSSAADNLDGSSERQGDLSTGNSQLEAPPSRPSLPGAWISSYDNSAASNTRSGAHGSEEADSFTHTLEGTRGLSTEAPAVDDQSTSEDATILQPSSMPIVSPVEANPLYTDDAVDNLQPPPLLAAKGVTPASPVAQQETPAPLQRGTLAPINTSLAQDTFAESANAADLSMESSPGDSENDRIRKDIARSLNTPVESQGQTISGHTPPMSAGLAPPSPNEDAMRESTVLPREYDSYWASTSNFNRSPDPGATREIGASIPPAIQEVPSSPVAEDVGDAGEFQAGQASAGQHSTARSKQPALKKKFSWEEEDEDDDEFYDDEAQTGQNPPEGLAISNAHLTQDGTFSQTSPATNVGLVDPSLPSQTGETSRGVGAGVTEPSSAYSIPEIKFGDADDEDEAPARGLTLLDPMSEDAGTRPTRDSVGSSIAEENALSQTSAESKDFPVEESTRAAARPVSQAKLTPFKEIAAMKQSTQRIQSYNETRHGFATMHTGLDNWLAYMVTAHPEHAKPYSSTSRPTVNTSGLAGSVRTRLSPSAGKGMSPGGSTPYYQQYLDSAGPLPTVTTQSGPSPSSGQADAAARNRGPSGQMQVKGKDILHSAGVLGGKASTGAKGLFAKGKSKFRAASTSEKDSAPSQTAASRRSLLLPTFAKKDRNGPTPPAPQGTFSHQSQSGQGSVSGGATTSSRNTLSQPAAALSAPQDSLEPSTKPQLHTSPLQLVENASEMPPPKPHAAVADASSTTTSELYRSPEDESNVTDTRDNYSRGIVQQEAKEDINGHDPIASASQPLRLSQDTPARPSQEAQERQTGTAIEPALLGSSLLATSKPLPPMPLDSPRESHDSFHTMQEGEAARSSSDAATAPALGFGPGAADTQKDTQIESSERDVSPSLVHTSASPEIITASGDDPTDEAPNATVTPNPTDLPDTLLQTPKTSERHSIEKDAATSTIPPLDSSGNLRSEEPPAALSNFQGQSPHQMPGQIPIRTPRASSDVPVVPKQPEVQTTGLDGPRELAKDPKMRATELERAKETAITPTETHPALRGDDDSEDLSPVGPPDRATDQMREIGGGVYGGLGPAVDLDKLPPSVRKQYTQAKPGGDESSASAQAWSREVDSYFGTTAGAASSSTGAPPLQSNSRELPSTFRSNQTEDKARGVTSPPPEGDSPPAKRRSLSPWRRFRARSRGSSVDHTTALAGSSASDQIVEQDRGAGNLQASTWKEDGVRSRGDSFQQEGDSSPSLSKLSSADAPRSKPPSSPWNMFSKRMGGAEESPAAAGPTYIPPSSTIRPIDSSLSGYTPRELEAITPTSSQPALSTSAAMAQGPARSKAEDAPGARQLPNLPYGSPSQDVGRTTTPSEAPNPQTKKLKRHSHLVKGTPPAVDRTRDTDTDRRRSWLGSLLGSSQPKNPAAKRLSKTQARQSQPADLFTAARVPDHSADERTFRTPDPAPRIAYGYGGTREPHGPALPSFDPIAEQPGTASDDAAGTETDMRDPASPTRASHVQYLSTQGLFPPRRTTARRRNAPSPGEPASQPESDLDISDDAYDSTWSAFDYRDPGYAAAAHTTRPAWGNPR